MPDERLLSGLSMKDEVQNIKMQLANAQLSHLNAEAKIYEFIGLDMDDYPGLAAQLSDAEVDLKRAENRVAFWREKVAIVERLAETEAKLKAV